MLIDRSFLPYFYATVKTDEKPELVLERIRDVAKGMPAIQNLEILERKFFGKKVNAIKITCTDRIRLLVLPKNSAAFRESKLALKIASDTSCVTWLIGK